MSIKLSDLTCEKCIYSHLVHENTDTYQCRRKTPDTWEKIGANRWCGEGKWLTKLSEFEPYMTRESYFLICNEALVRDEIIDPHEA